MNINQFDIFLAQLHTIPHSHVRQGRRPVVVVSGFLANDHSSVVTVVPLVSPQAKLCRPTHVFLTDQGLDRPSVALCEQVMPLDRSRLLCRLGHVYRDFDRLAIHHALLFHLQPDIRPEAAS